ncbi:winged helix-turn-helix transcriptional regulator [Candidatus Woesearchaeota archaeon]|nr:MAG: winged helix-turn-helix transcriptional regulator [Candidatus Woesearchaeota archaeon]
MNIGKTERTILCELDCNSRQTLASIGKRARLKKETVHYHIHRLEQAGIITGYPAIISLAKQGKIHAELFLRLHNTTTTIKKEMIHAFTKTPEITDIASCKGTWDLILGFVTNNIYELNTYKNNIFDAYSPYISKSSLSLTMETYFFGRKYLVGKNIHLAQHIDKPGNETTDELDKNILSTIAKNSRQTLTHIAKKTKTTPKTIAHRLKTMKQNGIIQKYTVALNLKKLGMTTYKLLIRLKNSKHKRTIIEFFHHQPNTVNVREVLADWNLEPTIEAPSQEQFYSIIEAMEEQHGELITTHTTLMIDHIHKTSYYS